MVTLFSEQFVDSFVDLDPAVLRSKFLDITLPPPGVVSDVAAENANPAVQLEFGCPNCSASFSTENRLCAHRRKAHGMVSQKTNFNLGAVTNQCPICFTVFSDRQTAVNHVSNSIKHCRCRYGQSRILHEIEKLSKSGLLQPADISLNPQI